MASDRSPAIVPRRRIWKIAGIAVALAIAALLALGGWLAGTESGARAAWATLAARSAGMLQVEGVHGHLAGPLQIDRLVLESPSRRIVLDHIRMEWRPAALAHGLLHVTSLQAARLSIAGKVEQSPAPAKLPASLRLPLALRLDQVQLDGGALGWGPVELLTLGGFGFSLDYDHRRYQLHVNNFAARSASASLAGNLAGEATLAADPPYALQAALSSRGSATLGPRGIGGAGQIHIDGSLARLIADIDFTISGARLHGRSEIHPFSARVLGATVLTTRSLDLSALGGTLPRTALDGSLSVSEPGSGQLTLINRAAGPYNTGQLPLARLQAGIRQDAGTFQFHRIAATLGTAAQPAGTVSGSGSYRNGGLKLGLTVDALNLRGLDARLRPTALAGTIALEHAAGRQTFAVDLSQPVGEQHAALTAHATLADQRLAIDDADLRLGNGRLQVAAHADLSGAQEFGAEGTISRFRLQDLGRFAQWPTLDLSGKFTLRGARQPQPSADVAFQIDEGRISGRPLQGDGQVQLRTQKILVPRLRLVAGDNRLDVHGELSDRNAQLAFALAAPKLEQLGPGFAGALNADGTASGSVARPRIHARWSGAQVRAPGQVRIDAMQGQADVAINRDRAFFVDAINATASARGVDTRAGQLAALAAHLEYAAPSNAPLALDVQAGGIVTPNLHADRFTVTAQGTTARHTVAADLNQAGNSQRWALGATGALQAAGRNTQWQGSIDRLDATGGFAARLASPAALIVSPRRVQLDRFRLDANSAQIVVERFLRDAQGIATRGHVDRLQLAQILAFAGTQPAVTTDLVLGGAWDLHIADRIEGTIQAQRQGGDVVMHGGSPVALGLRRLDASATATGGRMTLQLNADGQRLGHIDLAAQTGMDGGANRFGIPPDAPVTGHASIDIPSLAWVGPMIGPAVLSDGRLQGEATLAGTFAQPRFSGRISGRGLRLFFGDLGLDLAQGVLDGTFHEDTLMIGNLEFRHGGGSVAAIGPIALSGAGAEAQIALKANHFILFDRSDRKLVVSGAGQVGWHGRRAQASGNFDIDSGFFDIGREDMPQLSEDVVIAGRGQTSAQRLAATVDLNLNLGNQVTLKGRGLDALLSGQVRLTSEPDAPLRAQGTVRISQGTYTAYGRKLAIEQGVLRFNGPLNNPALDILAMRRGQEVEAGVAVRGTVLAPHVTLVSEPTVPDAEKLAWLVLGRPLDTAGSADLGALQSAAGALLSGGAASGVQSQIASAFGLSDFSIGTSQDNLQQRIITLGKRLSSRLYISYEQSLQSAASIVLLRYTLTPHLTVEAEAGTRSALTLFYNVTFD